VRVAICLLFTGAFLANAACSEAQVPPAGQGQQDGPGGAIAAAAPARAVARSVPPAPPLSASEEAFLRQVARDAWSYLDANYNEATGLVSATPSWAYSTTWDVGAQILGFLAARNLELLDEAEYDRRTARLLETLARKPLVRGATFNRTYSATTAQPGDGTRGATGWSATDLGRLLVALRVLWEHEPRYREQIEAIVGRTDMDQVVKDGYVHGQMPGSRGQPWTFQEGRIGYEQYVAAGFDLWGIPVANALDLQRHARPREVLGVELPGDGRGVDRLLSEPFILMGIELGWTPEVQAVAVNLLRAQEARYRQTGQVTIASEDAVGVPPHHFYYYCVLCDDKEFVVDIHTPGRTANEPRWVSTKAAFGWHALLPGEYTRTAVEHVQPARDERHGWASGVFEGSQRSTETYNINTSAVLLEIAYFQLRGRRPLIEP
jgi:hypothetical protein